MCLIFWPPILIEEMIRALFVEKQENIHSMLQRRCRHKKKARVLDISIGSVYNINKTFFKYELFT